MGSCLKGRNIQSMLLYAVVQFLLRFNLHLLLGFPGGSVVKNLPANAEDADSIPGSGRSPGEKNGYPRQPVFLPGKFHGGRILGGYSPGRRGVAKSWTQLND